MASAGDWHRTGREIMVVDDHGPSRRALSTLLREAGYRVKTAEDGVDALTKIQQHQPDLVISDVRMPRASGFDLVAKLRELSTSGDLPVILLSAFSDPENQAQGLDLGADDYVAKPVDADELLARIRVHLRHAARSHELLKRTLIDELTGLLNRRGVISLIDRELERSRRKSAPLSVLLIDVDRFKDVNDTYGHGTGDEVLRAVARELTEMVRASDGVGRIGGDEFIIVLPDTDEHDAQMLAERLREIEINSGAASVSMSVGSATTSAPSDSAPLLMRRADVEMYYDKRRKSAPTALAAAEY